MQRKSNGFVRLSSRKSSSGFSLIELCFALMLSISLLFILYRFYFLIEKIQKRLMDFYHFENNIVFIDYLFRHQIRNAGLNYCNHSVELNKIISLTPDPESIKNSETLTLLSLSRESELLYRSMKNLKTLYIPNTLSLQKGEALVIADCVSEEIFTIKKINIIRKKILKITSSLPLKHLYLKNAEIFILQKNSYFIGNTYRKDKHSHFIYGLFLRDLTGVKQELVENVQAFNIKVFPKYISLKIDLKGELSNKTFFIDAHWWSQTI